MVPFRNNHLSRGDNNFSHFLKEFFDEEIFILSNWRGNFRIDLKETNDNYLVEADLPGVKKGDIDLDYSNNYLTIVAKREVNEEDSKENYVRRERHYGEFRRSIFIDNVDEEKIEASFNDGVLKVILPKLNK